MNLINSPIFATLSMQDKINVIILALAVVAIIFSLIFVGIESYIEHRRNLARAAEVVAHASYVDRYAHMPFKRQRRPDWTGPFARFFKWYFRVLGI